MATKRRSSKLLNLKVNQLNECSRKFKLTLDDYVGQITGPARWWIERSEDCDQQQFGEITAQLDQAMLLLTESTAEIESNMSDQPLGTDAVRTTRTSATKSSHQTNFESQGLDQSLRSLLERLDAFKNVTDIVQELKKSVTDSEMRARLENSASQSEVQMINSHLRKVQKEFDKYQGQKFSQMQIFEKRLSKLEQTLSKTDSQVKFNINECFENSSEPEDQLPSAEKESEQIKIKPCKTLPGVLPKTVDRLSLLQAAGNNTGGTMETFEETLAVLAAQNVLMKAQFAAEIDGREKGSKHAQEWVSAFVKKHKLGTDERVLSAKDIPGVSRGVS